MNIDESSCRPYGLASALIVIGVSAWYPDNVLREYPPPGTNHPWMDMVDQGYSPHPPVNRQMLVKILPSRNFVGGR